MILIIGIGNTLRNDDGAGHALADRIEGFCREHDLPTHRLSVHQLTPEIAAEITDIAPEVVLFTDARDCTQPGSIPGLTLARLHSGTPSSPPMGHHLTPETLLIYTQTLFGIRPAAWMITAPGYDFGHGERLSTATEIALAEVDDVVGPILTAAVAIA